MIHAAKLDRFIAFADGNLLALFTCLKVAIAHPQQVTHVVLESPTESMRELADTPMGRTAAKLAELDWNVYLQTAVRVLLNLEPEAKGAIDYMAAAIGSWVDQSCQDKYVRMHEQWTWARCSPKSRNRRW